MSVARVTAVRPDRAVEGGRLAILGERFDVNKGIPHVFLGDHPARVVFASPDQIDAVVPPGFTASGPVDVRVAGASSEGVTVSIAAPFATGLHQIDNPVFGPRDDLYVTYSGSRGEQVPVSIFRVRTDGTRESFSSEIVNPTSMAVDPAGQLYVSSRFEGAVYRLHADGSAEPFVTDLGIACGLAFAADRTLYVGDRSGTVFKVAPDGRASAFATLPPSVAAFHLALAPDGTLFVTGPTLSSYDVLYKIDRSGDVSVESRSFGRPQGLAFDRHGVLHVADSLAGSSGVYRIRPNGSTDLVLAGSSLIGLAFHPGGDLVVCSGETAYRFQ